MGKKKLIIPSIGVLTRSGSIALGSMDPKSANKNLQFEMDLSLNFEILTSSGTLAFAHLMSSSSEVPPRV